MSAITMTRKYFNVKVIQLLAFLFGDMCIAANRTQLFKDVLDNHDSRVAPFNTISDIIPFSVSINLVSLRQVSEKDQTILTSSWITLGWSDNRLSWNPSLYGGIDNMLTTSKHVWTPTSICVFNEINENKCFTEERPVAIYNIGWVVYATSRDSITQCSINIKKFPFDSHSCFINIANYFGNADYLDPMLQYSKLETKYFQKNEEWDVTSTDVDLVTSIDVSSNTTYKQFYFYMEIKRRYIPVLFSVLLPVIALSILNIFCYLLPIESGEKMGTSMAIFLTFAVFLTIINDSMPKSEDTPYFTVYLMTQLLISGLTVVLESIVLYIHFNISDSTGDNKVAPLDIDDNLEKNSNKICGKCKHFKISGKKLDLIFMIFVISANVVSFLYFMAKCQ